MLSASQRTALTEAGLLVLDYITATDEMEDLFDTHFQSTEVHDALEQAIADRVPEEEFDSLWADRGVEQQEFAIKVLVEALRLLTQPSGEGTPQ